MINIENEIMRQLSHNMAMKIDLSFIQDEGYMKEIGYGIAGALSGYQLHENSALVIPKYRTIQRTWKERLFKRPLFKKFKEEVYHIPNQKVIVINRPGMRWIVGHPEIIKKILSEAEEIKNESKVDELK